MEIIWLLLFAAALVGLVVGLTGVGAGALMTPILVGVFGIKLPVAIATDLVFAALTKLVGVPMHHRSGSINWSLIGKLWSGSIPGVMAGVAILLFFTGTDRTSWLFWPLLLAVLVTAVALALRALSPAFSISRERKNLPRLVAPLGGFAVGAAVALTSIGAGVLGMALLVRLSPGDVEPRELVGTDLVHAIPIALFAGGAYAVSGLVSFSLLANLMLGSIPGVLVGSFLANRVPARALNGGLAAILATSLVPVIMSLR